MNAGNTPAKPSIELLATVSPTSRQRAQTLAALVAIIAGYVIAVPFAGLRLPQSDGFIPFIQAIIFTSDLCTAVLLFNQFLVVGSPALLVLANGYLFGALIVVSHTLTFPGAFAPTGLFGAGLQTAGWLYVFGHVGVPACAIGYACLKTEMRPATDSTPASTSAVFWSVVIVTSVVVMLTWAATGDNFLPALFRDKASFTPWANFTGMLHVLMSAFALCLVWMRRSSVLDQWLIVALAAMTAETGMLAFFLEGRFTLGWYAVRLFGVIASTVVLIALLTETMRLYVSLSRANLRLERERESKLLGLEVMVGSIVHEVSQPLTAIGAFGSAALRFLDRTPPDIEQARKGLQGVVNENFRVAETFDSIRALLKNQEMQSVGMNEVILEALKSLRGELDDHQVMSRVELTSDLSQISGHRGQLLHVVQNLVHNAVEAMDAVNDRNRVVRVTAQNYNDHEITIAVEDNGPGIAPDKVADIFQAFVTTKKGGMGMGLALCRMIVERHAGRIFASSQLGIGTRFEITLPTTTAKAMVAAEA
jgi:signal transduction histidine kinase